MFKKMSKTEIKVLVKLAQKAEKELHELLDYFNAESLRDKYPDVSERLKASCPQEFLGGDIYTMRAALKLRKDVITVVSRGLRNGEYDEVVLLDEKIATSTKGLLAAN